MTKFLRFIAILFLSISALFNIAGGAGTTCVALNPIKYEGFEAIAQVQWLYFIFVVVTFALGVMMARGVFLLVKGRTNGYRYALIALVAAILIGVVHILVSRALRNGSSMPVDGVVYTTVLTLIIFLLLRIPGIWERVDFARSQPGENTPAGGAAAIVTGLLSLTIQLWMAPSHTIGGVNYGAAFLLTTTGIGAGLLVLGSALILQARFTALPARKLARGESEA
jgi:hypothetical protein